MEDSFENIISVGVETTAGDLQRSLGKDRCYTVKVPSDALLPQLGSCEIYRDSLSQSDIDNADTSRAIVLEIKAYHISSTLPHNVELVAHVNNNPGLSASMNPTTTSSPDGPTLYTITPMMDKIMPGGMSLFKREMDKDTQVAVQKLGDVTAEGLRKELVSFAEEKTFAVPETHLLVQIIRKNPHAFDFDIDAEASRDMGGRMYKIVPDDTVNAAISLLDREVLQNIRTIDASALSFKLRRTDTSRSFVESVNGRSEEEMAAAPATVHMRLGVRVLYPELSNCARRNKND